MDNEIKKYRDQLVAQIKASGQELIDRAESMVSEDLDLISDFDITLYFHQSEFPVIRMNVEMINKRACDAKFNTTIDISKENN